ncbi:MAG TPA: triose-phosphate isomerase [Phycisphaerae bacterium]|nr:triose-phosphate isomerase [Phycisphaerae bacterium]HNU46502.1 triose-phosphate isomerase [Phycisphaerae bacterium]
MRKPLVAGNWKMFKLRAEAISLVKGIQDGLKGIDTGKVEVLVCPPYPWLEAVGSALRGSPILLGAQNAHEAKEGAFTGEVAVPMLKDAGCSYVIIGHSERRQHFGERGDRLHRKVRAVLEYGLKVIYCIGETLEEREAGRTEAVLERQIDEVLATDVDAARLVVAYEPVWAIGTGRTATTDQAQQAHVFIRGKLGGIFGLQVAQGLRIQYGGSVKPANAAGLLGQKDIDGALVGGACLAAGDFLAIIAAAVATAGGA